MHWSESTAFMCESRQRVGLPFLYNSSHSNNQTSKSQSQNSCICVDCKLLSLRFLKNPNTCIMWSTSRARIFRNRGSGICVMSLVSRIVCNFGHILTINRSGQIQWMNSMVTMLQASQATSYDYLRKAKNSWLGWEWLRTMSRSKCLGQIVCSQSFQRCLEDPFSHPPK